MDAWSRDEILDVHAALTEANTTMAGRGIERAFRPVQSCHYLKTRHTSGACMAGIQHVLSTCQGDVDDDCWVCFMDFLHDLKGAQDA